MATWSPALICFAALATASLVAVDASGAAPGFDVDLADSIIPEHKDIGTSLVQETDENDDSSDTLTESPSAAPNTSPTEAPSADDESENELGSGYAYVDEAVGSAVYATDEAVGDAIYGEAEAEGYVDEVEADYDSGGTDEVDGIDAAEEFRKWYNNASDSEKREAGSAIEAAYAYEYADGSGYGNDYSSSCDCSCHNTTSYACTEWPKQDESATLETDERCGTNDGCFGMGTFCYTGIILFSHPIIFITASDGCRW